MSNRNRINQNQNQGTNQNNNGQQNSAPKANEPTKKTFLQRVTEGYHSFRAKPIGRWTVRVLKGAGVAGVGIVGYKAGKRSVKPTTVLVTPIEEEPEEEPMVEEAPAEDEPETEEI